MTGDELSIIESITPEAIATGINVVQQVQSFLAENGEIVTVLIGTIINYMIKPLWIVKRRPISLPFLAFFVSVGVFYLISEAWTIKSLIFGGLYLWWLVTVQYLQDKAAVEKKMLDELTLPQKIK